MSDMSYAEFVRQIETRPVGMSPLRFVANMPRRPVLFSAWLLRWAEEKRLGDRP